MPKSNGTLYNHEKTCEKCDQSVYSRGLCSTHYYQERNREKRRPTQQRTNPIVKCRVKGCDRDTARADAICFHHNRSRTRWGMDLDTFLYWKGITACQACGSTDRLHMDHDHSHCAHGCGECIRGILCMGCNIALGHLGDSPTRVALLGAYARKL